MKMDEIYLKYKDEMLGLAISIATWLRESGDFGFVGEPEDDSDNCDEYQIGFRIDRIDGKVIAVTMTIASSEYWDGEENGVNFNLEFVDDEGVTKASIIPHNYSKTCWVNRNDEDAVQIRYEEFTIMVLGSVDGIRKELLRNVLPNIKRSIF